MSKDSSSWDEYHHDLEAMDMALRWPDEFVIRFHKTELRQIGARRVLEIGCGAGRHVYYFRLMGLNVVGIDVAAAAIDQTRRRLEEEGLLDGVELQLGEATRLPYADGRFDAVLAWRFLHVLSPERAEQCLAEVFRLLRPGGRVLVGTRSPRSTTYELREAGQGPSKDYAYRPGQLSERAMWAVYYAREDLERMFARFENVVIEHMEWTRQNGTFREAYWAVTAAKPGSVNGAGAGLSGEGR